MNNEHQATDNQSNMQHETQESKVSFDRSSNYKETYHKVSDEHNPTLFNDEQYNKPHETNYHTPANPDDFSENTIQEESIKTPVVTEPVKKKLEQESSNETTNAPIKESAINAPVDEPVINKHKNPQPSIYPNNEPNDLKITIPTCENSEPKIVAVGIGGAGCNAIGNIIRAGLKNVKFVACDANAQCLDNSNADHKIYLAKEENKGHGSGKDPRVGFEATKCSLNEIIDAIADSDIVFISAGMGGGTGTGGACLVAKAAKRLGKVSISIVSMPFEHEGTPCRNRAKEGVEALARYTNAITIIENQNMISFDAGGKTRMDDILKKCDEMHLLNSILGIQDIVSGSKGGINDFQVDFNDARTTLSYPGLASVVTKVRDKNDDSEEESHKQVETICDEITQNNITSHNISVENAENLLICVSSGESMTFTQYNKIMTEIPKKLKADPNVNIIPGKYIKKELEKKIRVSIIASGIRIKDFSQDNAPAKLIKRLENTNIPNENQYPDLYLQQTEEPLYQKIYTEKEKKIDNISRPENNNYQNNNYTEISNPPKTHSEQNNTHKITPQSNDVHINPKVDSPHLHNHLDSKENNQNSETLASQQQNTQPKVESIPTIFSNNRDNREPNLNTKQQHNIVSELTDSSPISNLTTLPSNNEPHEESKPKHEHVTEHESSEKITENQPIENYPIHEDQVNTKKNVESVVDNIIKIHETNTNPQETEDNTILEIKSKPRHFTESRYTNPENTSHNKENSSIINKAIKNFTNLVTKEKRDDFEELREIQYQNQNNEPPIPGFLDNTPRITSGEENEAQRLTTNQDDTPKALQKQAQ